ncbi:MAG: ATP-binding protein [Lautropia sp.]|nr:ATP-binding protein [Lautropia sp.]
MKLPRYRSEWRARGRSLMTRLRHSIQFQLALALALVMTLAAAIAGLVSFLNAQEEAHELQDEMLAQMATLATVAWRDQGQLRHHLARIDDDIRIHIQRLGQHPDDGKRDRDEDDHEHLTLPDGLTPGLHTLQIEHDAYRVLVRPLPEGGLLAVAQDVELRDEIAHDSAFHTVLPLLMLLPVLWLLVAVLVRQMFRPVARLAAEARTRDGQALHPLPTHQLPNEVRDFVQAINRLLARVSTSLEAQRRLVADAAHELRSPLTAMSLQAERLAAADMPDEARARLGTLRQGIERNRHLLEQLLSMARAQADASTLAQGGAAGQPPVALATLFRHVLEDLMPQAEARQVDLGVDGAPQVQVAVDGHDLLIVLRNLLDNAIRHAPAGTGQVSLRARAEGSGVVLEVEDNGPGIPAAERGRVLDAFYRVAGSGTGGTGLGLSIVQALLRRMGGRLVLADAPAGGLLVRVHLP